LISQRSNIEDPITGKKYTVRYPVPSGMVDNPSIYVVKCAAMLDSQIVVKAGITNNFTSYVYYSGNSLGNSSSVGFNIQVSDNVCMAGFGTSESATEIYLSSSDLITAVGVANTLS
jgi:hypothetical protein